MKVLVIGQGGREHAVVRALSLSANVTEIHAMPGNVGMKQAVVHSAPVNFESVYSCVKKYNIDLVVIGPEAPLVEGLSDQLRSKNIDVFGPSKAAAQLEGSKIFAKDFMNKYKIPTAMSKTVSSVEAVQDCMSEFEPPYVLKADGLCGGKGVYICQTQAELIAAATELFEDKKFSAAGEAALLEQFQPGYEVSLHVLTDGNDYTILPLAQDHKRLGDGDAGPNTGGMGTIGPIELEPILKNQMVNQVIEPTLKGLQQEGLLYRGVIFLGLMMTESGPKVLEYNVRFGDPETQVLLPMLDGDWGQVLKQVAQGQCPNLRWKSISSCCVVLAAPGYPDQPRKGDVIEGDIHKEMSSSYFLCAGVAKSKDQFVVDGGRCMNAVGLGSSLAEAKHQAYEIANTICWSGMRMRRDIGDKVL